MHLPCESMFQHASTHIGDVEYIILTFLSFVSTGEPKIGVYMLNSGGKKFYVKVRSCLCFSFVLFLQVAMYRT